MEGREQAKSQVLVEPFSVVTCDVQAIGIQKEVLGKLQSKCVVEKFARLKNIITPAMISNHIRKNVIKC